MTESYPQDRQNFRYPCSCEAGGHDDLEELRACLGAIVGEDQVAFSLDDLDEQEAGGNT